MSLLYNLFVYYRLTGSRNVFRICCQRNTDISKEDSQKLIRGHVQRVNPRLPVLVMLFFYTAERSHTFQGRIVRNSVTRHVKQVNFCSKASTVNGNYPLDLNLYGSFQFITLDRFICLDCCIM